MPRFTKEGSCSRKRKFENEASAIIWSKHVSQSIRGNPRVYTYICPYCKYYHITKMPQKKRA